MAVHVVGIAGSLRTKSFNRSLIAAAVELAPASMHIEVADLRPIPLYDADLQELGWPPAVAELRERVRAADALLISTPEYNHSVPGVLKNAIDWLSRGPESPISGKPLAIMGASNGGFGSVRAQLALRQVADGSGMVAMPRPEVLVSKAQEKIDASGVLVDEKTRHSIASLLRALEAWAEMHARRS